MSAVIYIGKCPGSADGQIVRSSFNGEPPA
jgi:hypothetical protein